jgi:hypothetical protein
METVRSVFMFKNLGDHKEGRRRFRQLGSSARRLIPCRFVGPLPAHDVKGETHVSNSHESSSRCGSSGLESLDHGEPLLGNGP